MEVSVTVILSYIPREFFSDESDSSLELEYCSQGLLQPDKVI